MACLGAAAAQSLNQINFTLAKKKRICYPSFVDEGRKRVLLIAACILVLRKLANWDGKPSPASECAIADAIRLAHTIMARIDSRWPSKP